jgi:hypothetical protein
MAYDIRFGPKAQNPEQWALVLALMQDAIPSLKPKALAFGQPLFSRYVAGELSWSEVHDALYTT